MDGEVNINNPRLQAILGRSKAVMAESDAKFPDKKIEKMKTNGQGSGTPQQYEEREPPMPQMPSRRRDEPLDPRSPEYRARLQASNMPEAIKRAMLESAGEEEIYNEPQQKTYSAEELGHNQPQTQAQPLYQQPTQQQPQLTKEDIKGIVKEVLAEMMVKTISENSVKRTLRTLMNEGKIKAKK